MAEERPECVNEDTASTVTLHNPQDAPQTAGNVDSDKRLRSLESGPETLSDKRGHSRCSLSTREEAMGSLATTGDTRGERAHPAEGGAGAQRPVSRRKGRRSKKRDQGTGAGGSGGDRGKGKFPPLQLSQVPQSWPVVPFALSSSLTDAHSIYSGTGGLSRIGVISGPFTNRQGSFRDRHVRPRTADGSTSPIRSAALIYVTTRSNFGVFDHQPKAVSRSVSSRRGDGNKWPTKRSIPRRHHHGGASGLGDNFGGGWEADDTTVGTEASYVASSCQRPEPPPPQQRPKTVPLQSTHAPLHGAGEGPRTWFRDAKAARSARRQQLQAPRGENSASGNNFFIDHHAKRTLLARARTAAARKTGHAGPGSCAPEDLILSPERAAARLASIRKAYGRESTVAIPFRGSNLQSTASKTSSPGSLPAHTRGRG